MTERGEIFKSDKILGVLVDKLKESAQSKGYEVSTENIATHLPLYSTKLLAFLDVSQNSLHLDTKSETVLSILAHPGQFIDVALHYFREVRSIPEKDNACWIYIEFFGRTVSLYMTIRNTNVKERISLKGEVSYINLLDNHSL